MNNKVVAGVLGAAALVAGGVALYFMAQEEEEKEIIYYPKVHTKEKLIEVMLEFEIEYASLYIHWYSMLKSKEKELGKGKIPQEVLEAAKEQIEILTSTVDKEVFTLFKINKEFFENWISKVGKVPEIEKIQANIEKNFDKLMKIDKPDFTFDYPKELTKSVYIRFIKVSYAKFRYDIYHHIQKILKENGKSTLTDDEFNEALKECSLPEIKIQTYRKLRLPEIKGEKPTRTALKAYLMIMEEDEIWHKEVLHIQKEHKSILFSIPEGKKIEGMHEDPFDVLDRELKMGDNILNAMKENNKQNENAADNTDKPKEEPSKKSMGAFSFLGNAENQEKLVADFLNRNKKSKVEELPPTPPSDPAPAEQNDDAKVEDEGKNDDKKDDSEVLPDVKPSESVTESVEVINQSEIDRLGEENKIQEDAAEPVVEEAAEPIVEDAAEPAIEDESKVQNDEAEPQVAESHEQNENNEEPVNDDAPAAEDNNKDENVQPQEDVQNETNEDSKQAE